MQDILALWTIYIWTKKYTYICESINLCIRYDNGISKWLCVAGIGCRPQLIILNTSATTRSHPPPLVNANLLPQEVELGALPNWLAANLVVHEMITTTTTLTKMQ